MNRIYNYLKISFGFILFVPVLAWCSDGGGGEDIVHMMTNLVLQLGVIIIAAKLGGKLFAKTAMPPVLGELLIGVLIGPYLLGGLPLPGFPSGIFPVPIGSTIPVSPQLYGVATVASIMLLFLSGLETDFSMLLRFSVAGLVVGIGGVVISFTAGVAAGVYFLNEPFFSPQPLFLGVISTATSVGITARILSDTRKMDSPEGVTILAGAVIDDVIGIILLAIIASFTVTNGGAETVVEWKRIGIIAFRAIAVWLGFTVMGLLFAKQISAFLKSLKSTTTFSVFAFGLALILAGVFERAGLAMIIGAYVMGLSLSGTDINYVIQEALHPLYAFLVPVFFVVMGMLVDVRELGSQEVLVFGFWYTVIAILAKIVGCGIPALFLNFTPIGALRIGLGMAPRGEVALIIAGIGLSSNILDRSVFGAIVMMTFLTIVVLPPILNSVLRVNKKGCRKEFKAARRVTTSFDFQSPQLTDLLVTRVNQYFRNEGFYVHAMRIEQRVYQIRREDVFITFTIELGSLRFETDEQDVIYVKTIVYEALLQLNDTITKVKDYIKPETLRRDLTEETGRGKLDLRRILDSRSIIPNLKSRNKDDTIRELVDVLDKNGMLVDKDKALEAIFEREKSMSTGMQHGVAIPHGKTDAVSRVTVAIGISRTGIDFQSIDGETSRIFVMVISPAMTSGPHIQFLASLSALLNSEEARQKLLECKTREDIYWFFRHGLG
jgi:fructose-specific phosphotransferase system IIA component